MQHRDFRFHTKAVSDQGTFSGYASVYNVPDAYNDVVLPGAFTATLEAWQARGAYPAMLTAHSQDEPVGTWLVMQEDERGLYVEGQLVLDAEAGKETHTLMKAGALAGLSIGYLIPEGGARANDGRRELLAIDLYEVSVVAVPANPESRVLSVKTALAGGTLPTTRDFERTLRELGFSRKQSAVVVASGYRALCPGDPDTEAMEAALNRLRLIRKELAPCQK